MLTIWTDDIKDAEQKLQVQKTLKASVTVIDRYLKILSSEIEGCRIRMTISPSEVREYQNTMTHYMGQMYMLNKMKTLFESLKE